MNHRRSDAVFPCGYRPAVGLLALVLGGMLWSALPTAQDAAPAPSYRVDPFWPKPLPTTIDEDGLARQWVTGMVGASCIDSQDRVITVNRGFLPNGLLPQEGSQSIPSPPVIVYDTAGDVAASWGDPSLTEDGAAAVLPHGIHGCFVDEMDNIWIAGNSDGVVQKWTHDGSQMLLQIGTKGVCDGPPTLNPNAPHPTCGEPGYNSSRTLLNAPADIAVDPNPDPVTGERGSVYIADGYGNHRIVVFDREGNYLRQWGSAGSGDGQFVEGGGGHPHCVVLGNDGLVYACDRGQNRIQVFDREGNLQRIIPVDPGGVRPGDAAGHRHRALPRPRAAVPVRGRSRQQPHLDPRARKRRDRRQHRRVGAHGGGVHLPPHHRRRLAGQPLRRRDRRGPAKPEVQARERLAPRTASLLGVSAHPPRSTTLRLRTPLSLRSAAQAPSRAATVAFSDRAC